MSCIKEKYGEQDKNKYSCYYLKKINLGDY